MATQELRVSNTAFLLDRMAADCSPLQEYRELTQNGIEAIQRSIAAGDTQSGEVVWDVDWNLVEKGGPFKLCVIDSGDGMSPSEVQRYINQLAVMGAGENQSLDGNFGVGAKITAGARNPSGVVYQTWKYGQGTIAHFWRDPVSNTYGLKQFRVGEDEWAYTAPLLSSTRPRFIQQHGTKVILAGKEDEQHTALPPEGVAHPNHWLTRYLNRRYYTFPEGVSVRVREFNRSDPQSWPTRETSRAAEGAQLRTVYGHKWYLSKYSTASGEVDAGDATLHWWLLDDPKRTAFTDQNRYWQASGHVAALYQNEIYELKEGQTARRLLMGSGVVFGSNRVVIYAEPRTASGTVTTNTARSMLLLEGDPLPWERWAEHFRKNMPTAIEAMMAEIAAASSADSHLRSIQERLKAIRSLFKLTRYRSAVDGDTRTSGSASGPGRKGATFQETRREGKRSSTLSPRGEDDLFSSFIDPEGNSSTPTIARLLEPKTDWRTLAERTREPGEMEDRAAEYFPELHELHINGDFRVFTDMMAHFDALYEGIDGAALLIREATREWFEQQLVETVMGVRAVEGSREWTPEQVTKALSGESLSAVVMPRYHVYNQIKRQLGIQLRSLRQMSAS